MFSNRNDRKLFVHTINSVISARVYPVQVIGNFNVNSWVSSHRTSHPPGNDAWNDALLNDRIGFQPRVSHTLTYCLVFSVLSFVKKRPATVTLQTISNSLLRPDQRNVKNPTRKPHYYLARVRVVGVRAHHIWFQMISNFRLSTLVEVHHLEFRLSKIPRRTSAALDAAPAGHFDRVSRVIRACSAQLLYWLIIIKKTASWQTRNIRVMYLWAVSRSVWCCRWI